MTVKRPSWPRSRVILRRPRRLKWHLSEFERPDHTVLTTSDAWETDIENQGHDPAGQTLDVEQITPARSRRGAAEPGPQNRCMRSPQARALHRQQARDHL